MKSLGLAALLASLVALGAGAWWLMRRSGTPESTVLVKASLPTAREAGETTLAQSGSEGTAQDRTTVSAPPEIGPVLVLPLVVKTSNALMRGADQVPRVAVAVGVGALSDVDSPVLAEVTTDDQGRGEVSIPWKAVEGARAVPNARIWARVVSPGFQDRTRQIQLPLELAETEIQVLAVAGGTVRGRLLDPEGRGVPGMVRAVPPESPTTQLGMLAQARADGVFELHMSQEGFFDLLADAGQAGTAALLGQEIRFATPPADLALRVQGPGVVRGHVREGTGRPAAGLRLCIFLALLDDERGSFVERDPEASTIARQGLGRTWATLETEVDGSFEARGFRADRYVVRAATDARGPYPFLLTPTPIQSDGSDLALVFDRPHIAVRVLRETGEVVQLPVPASAKEWDGARVALEPPCSWPTEFSVVATPVASEVTPGHSRTYLLSRRSGEEVVFEVEENRRYQVGLVGRSQVWRPTEVPVPPRSSRIEVVLTAKPETPMGTITVSVVDPQASEWSRVAIAFEDPSSGVPLIRAEFTSEGLSPQTFELPEGEYRMIAEGAPWVEDYHGTVMTSRHSGRYETSVRIASNQDSAVTASLPAGAKLHLLLRGKVREEDRDAVRQEGWGNDSELDYWSSFASLTLVPPEGWPKRVEFKTPAPRGDWLSSNLSLGSDSTSEILSAGRFRLEARMPGGRVASKDIVLVDGETTEVTLDLGP